MNWNCHIWSVVIVDERFYRKCSNCKSQQLWLGKLGQDQTINWIDYYDELDRFR